MNDAGNLTNARDIIVWISELKPEYYFGQALELVLNESVDESLSVLNDAPAKDLDRLRSFHMERSKGILLHARAVLDVIRQRQNHESEQVKRQERLSTLQQSLAQVQHEAQDLLRQALKSLIDLMDVQTGLVTAQERNQNVASAMSSLREVLPNTVHALKTLDDAHIRQTHLLQAYQTELNASSRATEEWMRLSLEFQSLKQYTEMVKALVTEGCNSLAASEQISEPEQYFLFFRYRSCLHSAGVEQAIRVLYPAGFGPFAAIQSKINEVWVALRRDISYEIADEVLCYPKILHVVQLLETNQPLINEVRRLEEAFAERKEDFKQRQDEVNAAEDKRVANPDTYLPWFSRRIGFMFLSRVKQAYSEYCRLEDQYEHARTDRNAVQDQIDQIQNQLEQVKKRLIDQRLPSNPENYAGVYRYVRQELETVRKRYPFLASYRLAADAGAASPWDQAAV